MSHNFESAELFLMLDASVDCIKLLNVDGTIRLMNRAGCEALGVPRDGPFGMRWLTLLPRDVRSAGRRALHACRRGKRATFAGLSQLNQRQPIYWDNILTPVFNSQNEVIAILCLSRNVTKQRVAERKLQSASQHDSLTTLPNRRFLNKFLGRKVNNFRNLKNGMGTILIDLDGLKSINDMHGHNAGDHIIYSAAKILNKYSKENNFFPVRMGGDEFAVIVRNVTTATDLNNIANVILKNLSIDVSYGNTILRIRASIGGAIANVSQPTYKQTFDLADAALYKAKASGGSRAVIWFQ